MNVRSVNTNQSANANTVRLLADVGGTNVRFALYANGIVREQRAYKCSEHADLATAVEAYLAQVDASYVRPGEAAFAVAAPIASDRISITNHPWSFSVDELRAQLRLQRLIVLNDFTALAMSIPLLPKNELQQVGGVAPLANEPIALVGPGTGLGVSGLIPTYMHSDPRWLPLQGYGGHVTMSARNEREAAVLAVLRKQFTHVSAERVISGSGLVTLYETLCALDSATPRTLQPVDVTALALQEKDAWCGEAVRMFCEMLATIASDVAVTLGAQGGVYVGGGIVPRLGEYFAASGFRARFEDKGRYREYLASIPVYAIRAQTPALLGLVSTFTEPSPRIESRA